MFDLGILLHGVQQSCGIGGLHPGCDGDLEQPHGSTGLLQHGQDGGALRRHRVDYHVLYQSAEWLTLEGLNEAADAAVKERSQ
jgi:hypothetical protein